MEIWQRQYQNSLFLYKTAGSIEKQEQCLLNSTSTIQTSTCSHIVPIGTILKSYWFYPMTLFDNRTNLYSFRTGMNRCLVSLFVLQFWIHSLYVKNWRAKSDKIQRFMPTVCIIIYIVMIFMSTMKQIYLIKVHKIKYFKGYLP